MSDLMNIGAAAQNGLSSAPLSVSSAGPSIPVAAPSGQSPTVAINAAQQELSQVANLKYPQDLPKYYMSFQTYAYTRQSLQTVGTLSNPLNVMSLPLPDQMLDVNQVAFDQVAFSATVGNIADAAMKGVNQAVATGGGTGAIVGALANAGVTGLAKGAVIDGGKAVFGEAGAGIVAAAGYSPNYFLTVVLKGPQYKQYSLNWTMAPRSPQEAASLTQIVRVFKDAMAPGLALGGALFSFPRVFQNSFGPNRGLLYQFKPSVLVNFSVNYTPGGMPSMKQADSTLMNWNAPTALRVSATFLELEFWLRGDFGDVSPTAVGPQQFSNAIQPLTTNRQP